MIWVKGFLTLGKDELFVFIEKTGILVDGFINSCIEHNSSCGEQTSSFILLKKLNFRLKTVCLYKKFVTILSFF